MFTAVWAEAFHYTDPRAMLIHNISTRATVTRSPCTPEVDLVTEVRGGRTDGQNATGLKVVQTQS